MSNEIDPVSHPVGNAEKNQAIKMSVRFSRMQAGAVLGGVIAGIARQLDTKPLALRIIFLTLLVPLNFILLILYFIFWAAMPADAASNIFRKTEPSKLRILLPMLIPTFAIMFAFYFTWLYILPYMADMYLMLEVELPTVTQIALRVADQISHYFIISFPFLIGLAACLQGIYLLLPLFYRRCFLMAYVLFFVALYLALLYAIYLPMGLPSSV